MVPIYLAQGWLSDRFGYKYLILSSVLALLFLSYPLFLLFQLKSFTLLLIIQLLFVLLLSGTDALLFQYLGNSFPTEVRCLGVSISFTLSLAIFGGTAPWVCTWLVHQTGLLTAPAFYIMFFALLALPIVLRLKAPSGDLSI